MSPRWLLCAMLAAAACADDGPRDGFVYTNDGGDSDGDGDGDDEDAGGDADAGRKRQGYERFCGQSEPFCTEAELRPTIDCYNDLCRSHYMECDLPCSAYIKCLDACDCADRRCVASCEPTPECATCRNDNVRCDRQMMCEMLLPACAFEQRERSCAELETCCPDLRGTAKGVCQDAVQADDAAQCSLYYGAYCEQPG